MSGEDLLLLVAGYFFGLLTYAGLVFPPRCPCKDRKSGGCYACGFTGWQWEWLARLSRWWYGARQRLDHLFHPNRRCAECGAPSMRWWRHVSPPCDCPPF